MADKAKIPGGYIVIARKIVESEIWNKPPLYLKVWVWLLRQAQHSKYKNLERGQLFTSIKEIQDAVSWHVGFRKERPTKDQIFQILDWLRKPDEGGNESNTGATMITTMKATHGMLVTIENYDYYQDSKNYDSNDVSNDEKVTKRTREQRQPDNINKNDNNDNNNKNEKNKKYIVCQHLSMTEDQYKKLVNDFGEQAVKDKLQYAENYAKLKNYTSLYLTLNNWLKKEIAEKVQQKQSKKMTSKEATDLWDKMTEGLIE